VTGQWYVRSDGNKVLFGTSSSCVGRKTPDVKQWLASIAFLIIANFDWVRTATTDRPPQKMSSGV
jgi:hypothetical protein